jgi:hypothetical protein
MAQRPRRKRRSGAQPKRKGGVMIGMRSGFKKAANSVVGSEQKAARKRSLAGTALSVLLIVAALAFLFYRWN